MLADMGHRPEPITGRWSSVRFPELGDVTIVEAWLHGDHEGVRRLAQLSIINHIVPVASIPFPPFFAHLGRKSTHEVADRALSEQLPALFR